MALSVNIWPQTDVAFLLACDNEACDKARVLDEKERKQKCFIVRVTSPQGDFGELSTCTVGDRNGAQMLSLTSYPFLPASH